jgi:hypothetical protein
MASNSPERGHTARDRRTLTAASVHSRVTHLEPLEPSAGEGDALGARLPGLSDTRLLCSILSAPAQPWTAGARSGALRSGSA